jgi:hypothetical protein
LFMSTAVKPLMMKTSPQRVRSASTTFLVELFQLNFLNKNLCLLVICLNIHQK